MGFHVLVFVSGSSWLPVKSYAFEEALANLLSFLFCMAIRWNLSIWGAKSLSKWLLLNIWGICLKFINLLIYFFVIGLGFRCFKMGYVVIISWFSSWSLYSMNVLFIIQYDQGKKKKGKQMPAFTVMFLCPHIRKWLCAFWLTF